MEDNKTDKEEPKTHEEASMYKEQNLPGAFDLFNPSWEAFKKNWVIFVFGIFVPILAILMFVVILEIAVHFTLTTDSSSWTSKSVTTTANILSVILGAGAIFFAIPLSCSLYYYVKLQSAKGVKLRYWPSLKTSLHFFWRMLGLVITRFFIILVGFILFIVPGFFMIRRYMMAPYFLVDEDIGINEAMKKSVAVSHNFSEALWGIIGVNVLFSVLGNIPVLGYVIDIAFSVSYSCATAVRYLQIKTA